LARRKKVVVIGGGALAVEALKLMVLARSEKGIIPRNPLIDSLLALKVFGSETIFSWIQEGVLRYRDLYDISLPRNSGEIIFTETPMFNSAVLDMIRDNKAS